jgi:hypothetical protein
MALPKLDVPTYELTLPLSNKKVKYRPFTVKEQRNLLMAMEANDSETIQQSIGDILNNCNLTEGIEIDKLPIIDVEYYFINLRAKSVGEVVDARYRCNNEVDGKNCNNIMETQVDLTKINVERPNDISNEIQLTDKFVIKLKYPEFSSVKSAIKFEDVNTLTFNVIAQSVEYIYDGEQFYYANEVPQKEMVEFVENLSQDQFAKIEVFFENLPKIRQKIDLKCKKCGFEHHLNVEGLENFFG